MERGDSDGEYAMVETGGSHRGMTIVGRRE